MKKIYLLVVLCLGIVSISRAQVAAHEDFNAPSGTSIDGLSTGYGWGSNWTVTANSGAIKEAEPFVYGDLQISTPYFSGNSLNAYRSLDAQVGGAFNDYLDGNGEIGKVGTTLWMSFLVRYQDVSAWSGKIGINRENSSYNAHIRINTNEELDFHGKYLMPGTVSIGDLHFYVFKFDFVSSSYSEVSLYINPTDLGGTAPAIPDTTLELSNWSGGKNGLKINYLLMDNNANDIDEIRFGKTYADVTPVADAGDWTLTTLVSPENLTGTTMDIGGESVENTSFISEYGVILKSSTDYGYRKIPLGSGTDAFRKTISIVPSEQYDYAAYAIIGSKTYYADTVSYTVPVKTPSISGFKNIGLTSMTLLIDENFNPNGTEYAILETGSNQYLDANGLLTSGSEVWNKYSTASANVNGLDPDTDYTFQIKARNKDGVQSALSASSLVHTATKPIFSYKKTGINKYTFYHADYPSSTAVLQYSSSQGGTYQDVPTGNITQSDTKIILSDLASGEYWFRLKVNMGGVDRISDAQKLTYTYYNINTSNILFVDNKYTGSTVDGTEEHPFKTIQKAVDAVVNIGTEIVVKEGVYREEVRVDASNITLSPFGKDRVVLSGCEPLLEWEYVGSGVYKAAMKWDITEHDYSNQLFIDGKMMHLLRWPSETSNNITDNPTWATMDEAIKQDPNFKITDEELPEPTDRWLGAQIFINPSHPEHRHEGQAWSGTIHSVNGKTFYTECTLPQGGENAWGVEGGCYYYLYNPTPEAVNSTGGITAILDYGEWWKNGDTVFVKTLDGSAPSVDPKGKNLVEAKKYPFVFRPVSKGVMKDVTIEGFELFATSITTDDGFDHRSTVSDAANVVIDNIDAKYVMHTADFTGGWYHQWTSNSGIILSGTNCVLKNSRIEWSAASAVSAIGRNHKILNNEMIHCNYTGTEASVINYGSRDVISEDIETGYNTIKHTQSNGIVYQELLNSDINKPGVARIHHNILYNTMTQYWDVGVIKGAGQYGQWVRIDHNIIYNDAPPTSTQGNALSGLYFDYGSDKKGHNSYFIADHNVVYNVKEGILMNHLNGIKIYNNTIYNCLDGIRGSLSSSGSNVMIKNNVSNLMKGDFGSSTLENNYVPSETEWGTYFTDAANGDFTLTSNAANLIDQASDVSPWNDPINGSAPDIGAYEYGKPKWEAGADIETYQSSFSGATMSVPGIIQAEDYDFGGEGSAYSDNTSANEGGVYRSDAVDITGISNGYAVYKTHDGEWLEYTFNLEESGKYRIKTAYAASGSGNIEIVFDGDISTGDISYASTGGFTAWDTITAAGIDLSFGKHVMRVKLKSDNIALDLFKIEAESTVPKYKLITNATNGNVTLDPGGNFYDEGTVVTLTASPLGGYGFDGWTGDLTSTNASATITLDSDKEVTANFFLQAQDPYGGTPWPIPGKIEMEDYDVGGQNISYYDNTEGNRGGVYRNDDVDIQDMNSDPCGGYLVGFQSNGEWKEYTVHVAKSEYYDIDMRVAVPTSGTAKMEVSFDKNNATTGVVDLTSTGGYRTCGTFTHDSIYLEAGQQIMRVTPLSEGHNIDFVYIRQSNGELPTFTLTTNVSPEGKGTVTVSPEDTIYNNLDEVIITATPIEGYQFKEWSGCKSGTSNPLTIEMNSDYTITAVFEEEVIIGTEEYGANELYLYPNPVNDILTIGNAENSIYHVVNVLGEKVMQGQFTADDNIIDVSSLPNGMYFLQVERESSKSAIPFVKD